MADRTMSMVLELIDNATAPLLKFKMQAQEMGIQFGGAMKGAAAGTNIMNSAVKETTSQIEKTGVSGVSNFGAIEKSVSKVKSALTTMAIELTGVFLAGNELGNMFKASTTNEILKGQLEQLVNVNKTYGVTGQQVDNLIAKEVNLGIATESGMIKATTTVLDMGKAIGLTGQQALDAADNIAKVSLAKGEVLGSSSPEDLARVAMKTGPLRLQQKMAFTEATSDASSMVGYNSLINTATGRMKILAEVAKNISPSEELAKRPWLAASNAVEKLKDAIGRVVAGPLGLLLNIATKVLNVIAGSSILSAIAGWSMLGGTFLIAAMAIGKAVTVIKEMKLGLELLKIQQYAVTAGSYAMTAATGVYEAALWGVAAVETVVDALNPFAWVIVAVLAAVAVLYVLQAKFGVITKVINAAQGAFKKLWDVIKSSPGFSMVASLFGVDSKKVTDGISDLNGKTDSSKSIWSKISEYLSNIWAGFQKWWGGSTTGKVAGAVQGLIPHGLSAGISDLVNRTGASAISGNTGAGATGVATGWTRGSGSAAENAAAAKLDVGSMTQAQFQAANTVANSQKAQARAARNAQLSSANSNAMSSFLDAHTGMSASAVAQAMFPTRSISDLKDLINNIYDYQHASVQERGKRSDTLRNYKPPAMASGSPYVPEDMIAVLHKGERVTPASQNRVSSEGSSSSGDIHINIQVSGVGAMNPNELSRKIGEVVEKKMMPYRRGG